MSKREPVTVELLEKTIEPVDRVEIERLLERNGFKRQGSSDRWVIPGNTEIPVIYLSSSYPKMDIKTCQTVARYIVKSRPPAAVISHDAPSWVNQELEGTPFKAELHGKELIVIARDHPEYRFSLKLTEWPEHDKTNLQTFLDHVSQPIHENSNGLQAYEAHLGILYAQGWRVERSGDSAELNSTLLGVEPVELKGQPSDLMSKLKLAKDRSEEKILAQMLWLESIKDDKARVDCFEIITEPGTKEKWLDVKLKGVDHALKLPMQGKDHFLDKEAEEKLLAYLEEARIANKRQATKPKLRRLPASAVQDPKKGQAVMVLDASAILDLCQVAGMSDKPLIEILKETAKLSNVSKIIIPDYIADFEVMGIARHYDHHDVPRESQSIFADNYQLTRQRFADFVSHAVRRHINKKGEVEYLTNEQTPSGFENTHIIIWETKHGREMANDIYELAQNHQEQKIREKYHKNASASPSSSLDKGEAEIEALCEKELPWQAPVFVMTNDLNYLGSTLTKNKTGKGSEKFFVTAYEYLDAELSARTKELRQKFGLKSHSALEIFNEIEGLTNGHYAVVRSNDTRSNRGGQILKEWLKSGASVKKDAAMPPAVPRKDAKPSKPIYLVQEALSQEAFAFGEYILHQMNECDLNRKLLTDRINDALPPHEAVNITVKELRDVLRGKREVEPWLLSAFMKVLIDNNRHVSEDNKPQAREEMRRLHAEAAAEQQNAREKRPFDTSKYHAFGEYLENRIGGMEDKKALTEFATTVRKMIGAIRPTEEVIDSELIHDVIKGKHIPSEGLALAMRRALNDPERFDELYKNAKRTARSDHLALAKSEKKEAPNRKELAEKIRSYFHTKGEGELTLNEIAEIGGIGKNRAIGSLLGNGGSVTFTERELEDYGTALGKWVNKHNPGKKDVQEAFVQDWQQLTQLVIESQAKAASQR